RAKCAERPRGQDADSTSNQSRALFQLVSGATASTLRPKRMRLEQPSSPASSPASSVSDTAAARTPLDHGKKTPMLLERIFDADLAHASYLIACQANGEAIVV